MRITYFELLLREFILYSIEDDLYDRFSYQFYDKRDWWREDVYNIEIPDDPMRTDIDKVQRLFK